MTLLSMIQLASAIISIYAAVVWVRKLRAWPLTLVAVIALLSNIVIYVVRERGLFTPADFDLFSSVRVLFMTMLIAATPYLKRVL